MRFFSYAAAQELILKWYQWRRIWLCVNTDIVGMIPRFKLKVSKLVCMLKLRSALDRTIVKPVTIYARITLYHRDPNNVIIMFIIRQTGSTAKCYHRRQQYLMNRGGSIFWLWTGDFISSDGMANRCEQAIRKGVTQGITWVEYCLHLLAGKEIFVA